MAIHFLLTGIMGLCLLIWGRKLFWLFVGIVGFAFGIEFALAVFGPATSILLLGVALLSGFLGAMLAVALQRFAIVLAGFIGGGYFAYRFAVLFGFQETITLAFFILGAILGAVLFFLTFDWALIIFSSLIGAIMIAQIPVIGANLHGIIFFLFAILGLAIQMKMLSNRDEKNVKKESSK